MKSRYDVVIVGGGHNGLVAAAYLAQNGLSVIVLERGEQVGGAAISAQIFKGVNVKLSRYAYLLSLMPQKIIKDLNLPIVTKQRATAYYTPIHNGRNVQGLVASNTNPQVTRASFATITGDDREHQAYEQFIALQAAFAKVIFPSLLESMPSREDLYNRCRHDEYALKAWEWFVEQPLGLAIEHFFAHDAIRGTLFTDAKIGALTYAHDPTLLQNRTFLYHIIGGNWRVPVGGMGSITKALAECAQKHGAQIITKATVEHIMPNSKYFTVDFFHDEQPKTIEGHYILANVSPFVLEKLVDNYQAPPSSEGSVFKINMVLKRLPRLRDSSITPEEAFSGTFHINEGYAHMESTYRQACASELPEQPPCEIYCHSLTDPSIVGESGYHTLTLFGLDVPYSAFIEQNDLKREIMLQRYLAAINQHLAEPIQDCLALDEDGQPCIEAQTPVDIEQNLNMSFGNIFHNELSWPFGETNTWGVETHIERLYICGSGALRGGAVSGITGHNAAMKVLGH